MAEQESQGLFSPFLLNRRCRATADYLRETNRILDLGGGYGHLANYLKPEVSYVCIDLHPPEETDTQQADLSRIFIRDDVVDPGEETLSKLAQVGPFDSITSLALVEHLPDPSSLVEIYLPFLAPSGNIIVTTPHPRGRRIHDLLARLRLCSWDAAREHESFLDKEALRQRVGGSLVELTTYRTFLFGFNQLAVFSPTTR